MLPALIVFAYLGIVLYIGIFAFRKGKESSEDFFLASRKLGPAVFLLSLFGTNMTAVAILGSSGFAYQRGIGVYGLMASSSGIVIPLTIFFIGTRLWALGKRHGHMTQVQYLRDRWEMGGIGTFIFALTAAMLVPYIIIGVMGGGTTLETISGGQVPYAVGGAIVAVVVASYVFFGGMRGTAWVNSFQTVLFLCFGAIAFLLIARSLGGFDTAMNKVAASPKAFLLSRERIPAEEFFSYMFIPLSSIMFPHIAIMCMTAEKVGHFKKTVIFYPICIMLIWLPSVFLGVVAASQYLNVPPGETNDIIIRLLRDNTNLIVSGILGAGIMACVMASDSQILALSTMFTEDLFAYYGGRRKFGPKAEVWAGRAFIVAIGVVAYLIALALKDKAGIFELAIRFAFSGFAALAPIMLAALFWKRSTKWGALAAASSVAAGVLGTWYLTNISNDIAPKPPRPPAVAAAGPGTAPPPPVPAGAPLTAEASPATPDPAATPAATPAS
ncbi:MAG TPA: sodium:solute symporter family protein, partial [Armatimonadaceae bacterium]|nr:sodium:solute symporter family protein [Armatimonadaceae bacterium]